MPKKIDALGPFALRTPLIIQLNTVFVNPLYQNLPVNIGIFEGEETLADAISRGHVRQRHSRTECRRTKSDQFFHFLILPVFRLFGSLTDLAFDRDSHFKLHDTQINPTLRASLNRSSSSRKPTMSLLSTQRLVRLSHFLSRLSTRPVPKLGIKSASDPRFYWVKPL